MSDKHEIAETLLRPVYRRVLQGIEHARVVVTRVRGLSEAPVVVVGSPRSGTSWLMRLIAQHPRYCTVFEPLHPRWWPEAREVGFGLRPWEGDAQKKAYLTEVFQGVKARRSIRRPRWDRRVRANPFLLLRGTMKRLRGERLVVKFVRATRLLPWLVEEFPDLRYVYIVRNPYAVINSQLSQGVSSYVDDRRRPYDLLNEDEQPKSMVTELCTRIRTDAGAVLDEAIVQKFESLEECLLLSWYADNVVAQQAALESDSIITITYENLVTNPKKELSRVQSHIRAEEPIGGNLHVKDPDLQLGKWKYHLQDRQIQEIRDAIQTLEEAYGKLIW